MFADIFKIDWMEVLDVIIRSLLSLVTLFLVAKMLGKRQVSQLTLFDYVVGISIGNFAAEMTINLESQEINGVVAVLIFGIVAYIIDILAIKSIKLRKYFMGTPTIVIQHGQIIKKNLRKVKFDLNDLLEECREKGCFDMSEIEYAIMEPNGKISILPKPEYKPVTIKDLNLKNEKQGLCANLVIDGKIMKNCLRNINKTEEWLRQQLKVKGYKVEDVFLATFDINENLKIYKNSDEIKVNNILE
ncbi:MAG: DUF421 domain-containing protein [Mollicutes bacterium]|nr:DUF421 domain-containing protein [Mollicutes bacterium]